MRNIMKRLLLTVIASLVLVSTSIAQDQFSTHWPEFDDGDYETQTTVIAYVQLDGEFITDDYANFEVAPFVGDQVRGRAAARNKEGCAGSDLGVIRGSAVVYLHPAFAVDRGARRRPAGIDRSLAA